MRHTTNAEQHRRAINYDAVHAAWHALFAPSMLSSHLDSITVVQPLPGPHGSAANAVHAAPMLVEARGRTACMPACEASLGNRWRVQARLGEWADDGQAWTSSRG